MTHENILPRSHTNNAFTSVHDMNPSRSPYLNDDLPPDTISPPMSFPSQTYDVPYLFATSNTV